MTYRVIINTIIKLISASDLRQNIDSSYTFIPSYFGV